jgi:hypothetical protein
LEISISSINDKFPPQNDIYLEEFTINDGINLHFDGFSTVENKIKIRSDKEFQTQSD